MAESRVQMPSLLRTSQFGGSPSTTINVMFVLSVMFLLCIGIASAAMGSIKADQVGILVNNFTGRIERIEPGTCFYNSIISDLHVIDRRQQTIEMRRTKRRADHPDETEDANNDVGAVKIKTIDGSDVSADIVINYVMEPEHAVDIVAQSGLGDAYKEKWTIDYARSVCRNVLGELTTEEFYDSRRRDEKARESLVELNKALKPWGISVTAVQVQDFGFYKEYEEKIREKKLADQEVEEQKSQAKAAVERQKRVRMEVDSRVNVQIAQFKGEMEKRRVEAEAQSNRNRVEADAYAYSTRVGADAKYYQAEKQAEAIKATRQAEADGLSNLARALEGGRNLVLLEYAKKLRSMRLSGQPVVLDTRMERLQHSGTQTGLPPMRPRQDEPEGSPEGGEQQ